MAFSFSSGLLLLGSMRFRLLLVGAAAMGWTELARAAESEGAASEERAKQAPKSADSDGAENPSSWWERVTASRAWDHS